MFKSLINDIILPLSCHMSFIVLCVNFIFSFMFEIQQKSSFFVIFRINYKKKMHLCIKYYFFILRGELSEIRYINHLLNIVGHKSYIISAK